MGQDRALAAPPRPAVLEVSRSGLEFHRAPSPHAPLDQASSEAVTPTSPEAVIPTCSEAVIPTKPLSVSPLPYPMHHPIWTIASETHGSWFDEPLVEIQLLRRVSLWAEYVVNKEFSLSGYESQGQKLKDKAVVSTGAQRGQAVQGQDEGNPIS